MSKGLLAQWRGSFIARGMLAAVLFTVPVAVAAAIGFQGSVGGLTGGLDSLASGPAEQAQPDAAPGGDPLDDAILSVAAPVPGDGEGAAGGGGGSGGSGGGGGGVEGTQPGGGGGGGGEGPTGPGNEPGTESPGGGGAVPPVEVPGQGGGGTGIGPVDDLLGGVNDTLNGLLGGGGGN